MSTDARQPSLGGPDKSVPCCGAWDMGGIKTCQLPEGHKLPHIHFDTNGTTAWEWDWKEKEQVSD